MPSIPIPIPEVVCPSCHQAVWVHPHEFGKAIVCPRCAQAVAAMQSLPVSCPACGKAVSVGPKSFGQDVACSHCAQTFRLSQFMRVPCPKCREEVRVRPDYIGAHVTCKFCDQKFRVHPPDGPAHAAPSEASPLDEAKRLREKVAGLEADLRNAQAALAAKADPPSKMIVHLDEPPELVELRHEARGLRKQLEQARADVEQLSGRCQSLEGHKDQAAQSAKELEALRAERGQFEAHHKAHKAEADLLKAKLHEATERQGQWENEQHRLDAERQAREEQLALARQEGEATRHEREAAHAEIERLRGQANQWASERETLLEQWHRDHHEKIDALEKRLREEQARLLAEREQQLDALRGEAEKQRQALTDALENGHQERDAAREQAETARRHGEAERQALEDRLGELTQRAQAEQERLQTELGRSDAARRQLEEEQQTLHAEAQRGRQELESVRHDLQAARQSAEEAHHALHQELQTARQECEALRSERESIQAQAAQKQLAAEATWHEQMAEMRHGLESRYAALQAEADRRHEEAETLRSRVENGQREAQEREQAWDSERAALLEQARQHQQRVADLDREMQSHKATALELRQQLEAPRPAAAGDQAQLRHELDLARGLLQEARAELEQARQQNEQRSQAWSIEKRSLQGHHQEERRRLTEEFEQRMRAELDRCRESHADQLAGLERERDTARTQFEAMKQAMYHPHAVAEDDGVPRLPEPEDDGIPRLPEPEEQSADEGRSVFEQRLLAEQSQLNAALRKNRQQLDDQKQHFEEERQALLAEVYRLRHKSGGGRESGNGAHTATAPPARRPSRALRLLLYLALFLIAVFTMIFGHMAINMARGR